LTSAWFYLNYADSRRPLPLVLSLVLFACAALSKINTVVAPGIFFLYEYRSKKSIRDIDWRALIAFAVVSLIFVRVHMHAFSGNREMLEGIPYSPFAVRLMNFPMLLSFYLDTTLAPYNLSVWQQFPVQQFFTWVVGLAWAGLGLMGYFLYRAGKNVQFWAGWFLVFLFPVLQFVPFPIWVADRYLYIPLVGGCVLLAKLVFWGLERMESRVYRRALVSAVGLILVLLAWRSQVQLEVWRDELSLWSSAMNKCGRSSAYCHSSYGLALMAAGKTQQGGNELVEAVNISPTPVFLGYLADALTLNARNYPEAIRMYKLALKDAGKPGEDPYGLRNGSMLAKMARAYMKQGELDLAAQAIRLGAAYEFRNPLLATADTFLQWKRGDLQAARGSLDSVSLMTGKWDNPEPYLNQFWADAGETRRMMRDVLSQPKQIQLDTNAR
jgi:tetratricopeptide (TPR) repeat protein